MKKRNPFPKDSLNGAAWEFREAVIELGQEIAKALRLYQAVEWLADRIKRKK